MVGAFLKRLSRDRRGSILAEFALSFPVLVLLILGGVEIGRYILLQQKLEGIAVGIADLVSQAETLTVAEVDDLFAAVDHIARPFSLGSDGLVIVSSVSASNGNPPQVNWQRTGGGTGSATSAIGAPGEAATLPAGFVVRDGETVIVGEVYYSFSPFFGQSILPSSELYNRAMFRPRFGALTSLN